MKTKCLVALLVLSLAPPAFCKDLGTAGKTYEIAEPDLLAAIQERVAAVDWGKYLTMAAFEKKFREYRPQNAAPFLPAAEKDAEYPIDMTYVTEFAVPDGNGGILYPKGYAFDPNDYLAYSYTLVIIDAGDKRQVEWFKASPYVKDIKTKLLITGGSWWDISEAFKRQVFLADSRLVERFRLKALPSIVRQDWLDRASGRGKRAMWVMEMAIGKK